MTISITQYGCTPRVAQMLDNRDILLYFEERPAAFEVRIDPDRFLDFAGKVAAMALQLQEETEKTL